MTEETGATPRNESTGHATPSADPIVPISSVTHKTDEITVLQDSIDQLSLSMFEALRGLRDAVAPESGNLDAANTATITDHPASSDDFEEFMQAYRSGDAELVAKVQKVSGGSLPQKKEDLARIHAKLELEKDSALVKRLASSVLEASQQVDRRVASLSGMERTRTQQMQRIEELMEENRRVEGELEDAYSLARQQRDEVRKALREKTSEALGIEEQA